MSKNTNTGKTKEEATSEAPAEKASGAVVVNASAPVGTVNTKEEVAAVVAAKAEISNPTFFSTEVEELLTQLKAAGDETALNAIDGIKEYLIVMAPGKGMTAAEGARNHTLLFRNLQSLINGDTKDFTLAFATVLKIFSDFNKAALSPSYVFRFTEMLSMNKNDIQSYYDLITLLNTAAPVEGRAKAMNHVDFGKAVKFGFTEVGARRILTFFNK